MINILKAHNIYEDIKKRNVEIAITIDGSEILNICLMSLQVSKSLINMK